ncbi:glutathione S-transferase family protein [Blastomonas sp.]|uniref:glutathione S-transferase family protein n=1 Tax=Blastomonas sp. TaxID=1909299 RepID=UPI002635AEEE|nr:glutathione S-transferase family protein [Blastomonas sp.]MDM7956986.1 glutathione S-transferase family protein [Blastomonas sp.]
MKLYSANMPAPNPRRVRIFAAEKGIALPEIMLSLVEREHRSADHLHRNSLGQVPVLELEDGTTISETIAICRYIEELQPDPPMFGRSAKEKALIDMWTRRIDIQLGEPTKMFWRHAHPATAALIEQHKVFGESNRDVLARAMQWLNTELEDGRSFLTGDSFTIADIAALTVIDFAALIGLDPLVGKKSVTDWHARVSSRPSVSG